MAARRPWLYRLGSRIGVRALRLFGRRGWIGSLPLAGGWTAYRDLPRPSIDTGMGMERVAAILQGVHDNYDTDTFRALIAASAELTPPTTSRMTPIIVLPTATYAVRVSPSATSTT